MSKTEASSNTPVLSLNGLTIKQKIAYELMANRQNIFLSGSGGTGKSFLIKKFCEEFRYKRKIAICSTTGISALLIGGTTIHSFLGLGLGTDSADVLYNKIFRSNRHRMRWLSIDTLIIDEISMLSPELFDKIENIATRLRCTKYLLSRQTPPPFGGIQLILSGDFLQLPVVNNDKFCFEAKSWNRCVNRTIELNQIVRQKDFVFAGILNEIRYGIISDDVKEFLKTHTNRKIVDSNGIKPTKIYTTNADVNAMNDHELDILANEASQKGEELEFFEYEMKVAYGPKYASMAENNKKNCQAPVKLELCKGAQVMLLANIDLDNGLCNGSRGIVLGFVEKAPFVRFVSQDENVKYIDRVIEPFTWEIKEDEEILVSYTQYPLKLAYAITVHKSQGASLDYAEIDLENVFVAGQAYVALSRVRTSKGLNITNININKIWAHPKALEFYKKINTPEENQNNEVTP